VKPTPLAEGFRKDSSIHGVFDVLVKAGEDLLRAQLIEAE